MYMGTESACKKRFDVPRGTYYDYVHNAVHNQYNLVDKIYIVIMYNMYLYT